MEDEMKIFLALIIAMGQVVQEDIRDYWSTGNNLHAIYKYVECRTQRYSNQELNNVTGYPFLIRHHTKCSTFITAIPVPGNDHV